MVKRGKSRNRKHFVIAVFLAFFVTFIVAFFSLPNQDNVTGMLTLKGAVNKIIDVMILKSESQKFSEASLTDINKISQDNIKEKILIKNEINNFNLDTTNASIFYTIKTETNDERQVEAKVYYKGRLIQPPQRDRPREGDLMEGGGRDYFDIRIIADDEENRELVRNGGVLVYIYYEGINPIDSYLAVINNLNDFDFENDIRISLVSQVGNEIPRNQNFDVILYFFKLHSDEDDEQFDYSNIIMIKPLRPRDNGRLVFNLSETQRIRTNIRDINERRNTGLLNRFFGLRINPGRSDLLISGWVGFYLLLRNENRINNMIYISEDAFNQDWTIIQNSYLVQADVNLNPQTHLDLTINNIHYPVEESYNIDEDNLRRMEFNIKNPFKEDVVSFIDWNLWRISNEALFPIRVNYLFTDEIYNDFFPVFYLNNNNFFVISIPFLKQYEQNQNAIWNIIEKPVSLRLDDTYGYFLWGYLVDYNNFSYEDTMIAGYPSSYMEAFSLRGSVRIVTPERNIYSSLANGSNFYIQCNDGRVDVGSFRGMECVEGNYTIRWAFRDIIKDRDLYLDAVVHYDGENWNIVSQNPRVVSSCNGSYFMTWRNDENNIIRQDPYNILTDRCGPNGFRCLSDNNEISPSCYNQTQCSEVCNGSNICVNISEWQNTCRREIRPTCGNGIKEGTERCDGNDWGNVRGCGDLGYDGGRLRCVEPDEVRRVGRGLIPCRFDTSQCYYARCGMVLRQNTVLTRNLNCSRSRDGLIIGANNIILDCNNHTIIGSGEFINETWENSVTAIRNMGFHNVTVRNCNFEHFYNGIYFGNSNNGRIYNINGRFNEFAVALQNSSRNNISRITSINRNEGYGVLIYSSLNNSVSNSTFYSTDFGLEFSSGSSNNKADGIISKFNTVGIEFHRNSTYNVLNNSISNNNSLAGIYFAEASNFNFIQNTEVLYNEVDLLFGSNSANNTLINVTYNTTRRG